MASVTVVKRVDVVTTADNEVATPAEDLVRTDVSESQSVASAAVPPTLEDGVMSNVPKLRPVSVTDMPEVGMLALGTTDQGRVLSYVKANVWVKY